MIIKLVSTRDLWKRPVTVQIVDRMGNLIGHIKKGEIVIVLDQVVQNDGRRWFLVHSSSLGVGWMIIPHGWTLDKFDPADANDDCKFVVMNRVRYGSMAW